MYDGHCSFSGLLVTFGSESNWPHLTMPSGKCSDPNSRVPNLMPVTCNQRRLSPLTKASRWMISATSLLARRQLEVHRVYPNWPCRV